MGTENDDDATTKQPDTTPFSTPEEYADARQEAIESNDMGKMAQFIGSLPPHIEEIFRQLRAEADRENRALIGGLIGMVTGIPIATNAAPSDFLESFLKDGARLTNKAPAEPETVQERQQVARTAAPKPFSPSDY